MDYPFAAAEHFAACGRVLDLRPYGKGNVNDTFLVTAAGEREERFILQRLNPRVFPRPGLILENLRIFTAHMERRLLEDPLPPGRTWRVPRVLATGGGRDHWLDPEGSCWRALSFIDHAQSFDTIQSLSQAQEVGYALGLFHYLLSDLPGDALADTLPGFHITPAYLRHYDAVLSRGQKTPAATPPASPAALTPAACSVLLSPLPPGGGEGQGEGGAEKPSGNKYKLGPPEVKYCLQFIEERRTRAGILEEAKTRGKLALRPIHGDPKVDNFLLDAASGRAVSLVDLDTVKPGLVHYDLGDLLRSGCNPWGEEADQWEEVRFQPDLARAIFRGYLAMGRRFLTPSDHEYLFDAVWLMTFELGLRFFTDFLEGNVYFKAGSREHNLARALVQFKLAGDIEAQERDLRSIIRDLRHQS